MQTLFTFTNRYKPHLYFIGMALMAIALPVSEFLMSISMFTLALAWLLNGPKKMQWQAFKNNKLAWITFLIFFIDVAGLINTSNFDYALSDLRVKLPLLLVPVFVAPAKFKDKEVRAILALFVGSTLVGSLICFINYHINLKDNLFNIREVSIYISHIRFGLMINISILILVYFAIKLKNRLSMVLIIAALWLVYFLVFLGSVNGYIILTLLILIGAIVLVLKSPYPKLGLLFGLLIFLIAGYISVVGFKAFKSYFLVKNVAYNNPDSILKKNSRGNVLVSNKNNKQLQNGYYVWRNISRKELKKEWKKRADDKYHEYDIKNQIVTGTLIKYLTSKGLPKDADGMAALSNQDIKNVELGHTDYRRENWNNLEFRIDQFFFQINAITKQNNPEGKSFVQRIYYLDAAINIIKNNFFIGVGTGDIQDEFDAFYQADNSKLPPKYRIRTHNQYLSYFVTNGILGFLLFLYASAYPFVRFSKSSLILAIAQFILLFSFLSEDTLESQPGVTLYVFIIALGIVSSNYESTPKRHKIKIVSFCHLFTFSNLLILWHH